MRFSPRATWPTLLAGGMLAFAVPLAAQEKVDVATIERIKTEALQHSQVMDIMSYLTDVYGPRLTWSPNAKLAGEWTVSQLKKWGVADARLEPWSTPTGIGWRNERFSLQAISPNPFIIAAAPRAWSAGTNGRVTGPAIRIQADCFAELQQKYDGKLKNAFLMFTAPSATPVTEFNAYASRNSDSALAAMAAPPIPMPRRAHAGHGAAHQMERPLRRPSRRSASRQQRRQQRSQLAAGDAARPDGTQVATRPPCAGCRSRELRRS